jgi:transcriptional regulator with XRE-family HTH domain
MFSAILPAMSSFGENLRAARERMGLTQEQVADRLKLKRSAPLSIWEGYKGAKTPKAATVVRIAKAIGVEPAELLEGVHTELDRLRGGPTLSAPAGTNKAPIKGGADVPASAVEHRKSLRRIEASLSKVLDDVRRQIGALDARADERSRKRG